GRARGRPPSRKVIEGGPRRRFRGGRGNAPAAPEVAPAMIPYFQLPPLRLGPIEIHAFGVLTALGIYLGARLAARAARRYGPGDDLPLVEAAPWMVLAGLLMGHFV